MSHLYVVPDTPPGVFQPSEQQEAIFQFVREGVGHGVVVARAGTGKTTTIVQALDHVPKFARVLCCAFNRRIRDELERRVPQGVKVQTLHQLGRATLGRERNFRSWRHEDEKDREVAESVLRGTRFNDTTDGQLIRDEVLDSILTGAQLVKSTLTATRADLVNLITHFELDVAGVLMEELAALIAQAVKGALDHWPKTSFDDEVWMPVHYGLGLRHYDIVFVDECQDLSLVQLRLAQSAMHPEGRIIAVGDPAQAIYSWRGADKDTVGRIVKELNAPIFPLSVSFRCPRAVVALAKKHVPDFEHAEDAPEGVVAMKTVEDITKEARPGDFVISRLNAPLARICLRLVRKKIPARVVGQDICVRLHSLLKRSKKQTVDEFLPWLTEYEDKETRRLMGQKREPAARNFRDLCDTVREFTEPGLTLQEVKKSIDDLFVEDRRAYVVCSTVHRLKGDEANRVFLLEETFFIARGDPEEERNIHYVALTRSKRELYQVRGLYPPKAKPEETVDA